jgi:hypothetical protein
MPRTLSEVLDEYAVKHRDKVEEFRTRRQEWIDSVTRLMNQIQQWLNETDKEKVLRIDPEIHRRGEELLGWYEVPGLTIYLGHNTAEVKVAGRSTLGRPIDGGKDGVKAEGRVDISGGGYHFMLFRALTEQGEQWHIVDPDTRRSSLLTRETFDSAMARIFG